MTPCRLKIKVTDILGELGAYMLKSRRRRVKIPVIASGHRHIPEVSVVQLLDGWEDIPV